MTPQERLRAVRLDGVDERGIINGHDVSKVAKAAGLPTVVLAYHTQESGRMYRPAKWEAIAADHQTNPAWKGSMLDRWREWPVYKYGRGAQGRQLALNAAQTWASETYGVTDWATIPGLRGYVFPKPVADLVRRALRQVTS